MSKIIKIAIYLSIIFAVWVVGGWLLSSFVESNYQEVYDAGFEKGLKACEFYQELDE